ncbi:rho GTPase-activating protein 7-like isoform X3 [Haliotis rufescens]|nr:rho GTPase-activating protein 7-like isoform X3 [Haliotis rufescens]
MISHVINQQRTKRKSQSESSDDGGSQKNSQSRCSKDIADVSDSENSSTDFGCQVPPSPIKICKEYISKNYPKCKCGQIKKNCKCVSEKQNGRADTAGRNSIGCQTVSSKEEVKDVEKMSKSIQTKDKLLTLHKHGRVSRATQTHRRLRSALMESGKQGVPTRSKSFEGTREIVTRVNPRQRKSSDSGLPNKFSGELTIAIDENMQSLMADKSPEMQVVVNSSTPVLDRRRQFRRGNSIENGKKIAEASERSKVDPIQNVHCKTSINQKMKPSCENWPQKQPVEQNGRSPQTQPRHLMKKLVEESIIISPEMSRTWHGITGSGFSKPLAPKMGVGMVSSESAPHFTLLNRRNASFANIGNGMMTMGQGQVHRSLPHISKSLLDAMHKRYCSYQYSQQRHLLAPGGPPVSIEPVQVLQLPPPIPPRGTPVDSDTPISTPGSSHQSSPRSQHTLKGEGTPDSTPTLHRKLNAGLSERRQAEIEAIEACKWLRAAGFPQYAQMYEDGQFPVDIAVVERDHDFLDRDSIQSLFRRLNTLNRCAVMKIDAHPHKGHEDSDDEDLCALSSHWEYQQNVRRWSRKDLDLDTTPPTVKSSLSHDSLLADQDSSSPPDDSPVLDSKMPHVGYTLSDRKTSTPESNVIISPRLRRAASERIRSAKNLLKKMESFKTKRNKKFSSKNIVEISSPVVADRVHMQAKIQHLNCVDISPTSELPSSHLLGSPISDTMSPARSPVPTDADTSLSDSLSPVPAHPVLERSVSDSEKSRNSTFSEYYTAHSQLLQSLDSEQIRIHQSVRRNNSDTNLMEIFLLPHDHKPGSFPKRLQNGYIDTCEGQGINYRTGSFSLGRDGSYTQDPFVDHNGHKRRGSHDPSMLNRISMYDNMGSPVRSASERYGQRVHFRDGVRSLQRDPLKLKTPEEPETPDEELSSAKEELDHILHELFENINGLNEAIYGKTNNEEEKDSSFLEVERAPSLPMEEDVSVDHEEEEVTHDNDISSQLSSSQDASDHDDIPAEELPPDDSLDNIEGRERRDSGVGSSLTRAPSDKKRKRIRWHSFQKCHRPSLNSRDLQIAALSVRQLMVLRKLSLLKLTAIMEKYSPTNRTGWNWMVPRFMKRNKTPDYSDKNVFGLPLHMTLQRSGQPLPQCILYAMRYLRKAAGDALGIFRKSGVRSRIQKLRNDLEAHPEIMDFEEMQAYDVADVLKQYFRELPECLLTNKLSETFISIFTHVPSALRIEAIQAAIVLLPDENREVLQSLLLFLSDISQHADEHQMTASNLAVCFAPSLFNMCGIRNNQTASPKRNRKNLGAPEARDLLEQKAAHECLTAMVLECKKIFMIAPWVFSKLHLSCVEGADPMPFEEFYKHPHHEGPDFKSYGEECIQTILKESHDKNRGWVLFLSQNGTEVYYRKPTDSNPLREWKCTVEIEAPPVEVLNRVLHERHVWDEDLLNWSVVETLDKHADVFQYVCNSMAPHPTRHYTLLRYWRTDLVKGACALVSTSVEHPDVHEIQGVQAVELMSHFLIEPCGSGRARLIHITRSDTRGRCPEWYNKSFGYICCNSMERVRDSFRQQTDLPETNV